MSIQTGATVFARPVADADSIPMMAQVYARVRNRLREVEALLRDQPQAVRAAGEDAVEQRTEPNVLLAQATALRAVAERALVVPIGTRAIVGSTVEVCSGDDRPLERYEIVVPTEADPAERKVSFDSPIGSALLGREVGDVTVVQTPRGQRELRVIVITHQ